MDGFTAFTAIKRCRGLLKIFQSPKNRLSIEQELLSASRRNEDFWIPRRPGSDTYVPFPFITTCLVIGASFDAADGYFHQVSVESWGMAYDEGSNNDAKIYLDAYYPEPNSEQQHSFGPYLKAFETRDLVTVGALSETWPDGEWNEPEAEAEDGSMDLRKIVDLLPNITSLQIKALDQLVSTIVNDPEGSETSVLSQAALVPSFLPRLNDKIYEHAESLKCSPALVQNLTRALEREKTVDLTPFSHLGIQTMTRIVDEVQKDGQMIAISLSNSNVEKEGLLEILAACPALEALYLLCAPNLSIESLNVVLTRLQLKVHEIYHTDLLKNPFTDTWTDERVENEQKEDLAGLRFTNLHPVHEIIWVSVDCKERHPTDWSKLVPEDTSDKDQWNGSESNMTYVRFMFGDTPLSLARLVSGLINVFKYACITTLYAHEFGPVLSRCVATGKPSVSSESRIAPLSTLAYNSKNRPENTSATLSDGRFAILAINDCHDARNQSILEKWFAKRGDEAPIKGVRYASIIPKADNEDEFDVLSVPQFLERITEADPHVSNAKKDEAMELSAYWTQQMKMVETIGTCNVNEASTIARKVFGKKQDIAMADTNSTTNKQYLYRGYESTASQPKSGYRQGGII